MFSFCLRPAVQAGDSQAEVVVPDAPPASWKGQSKGQSFSREHDGEGESYKCYALTPSGQRASFWHDVPLSPEDHHGLATPYVVNFVSEIPKSTRKKFEVSTKEEGNPIKQDKKNGKLREYGKGDIFFNYGCVPQTWEDPAYVHPDVGVGGDGDPLDACEIGLPMPEVGEIRATKVLGVICMIDEDEADWKLIVIDVTDPWAAELNDISDVDRLLPGTLNQIREWWRTYKVAEGKPLNKFGLDEQFLDRTYAMEVIQTCHQHWQESRRDHLAIDDAGLAA